MADGGITAIHGARAVHTLWETDEARAIIERARGSA